MGFVAEIAGSPSPGKTAATVRFDERPDKAILFIPDSITSSIMRLLGRPTYGFEIMNGYYRPQEVLVMEAELARAKAYLAKDGVPAGLLDCNAALLAELVIKARDEPRGERDRAAVAALQFKRMMLG